MHRKDDLEGGKFHSVEVSPSKYYEAVPYTQYDVVITATSRPRAVRYSATPPVTSIRWPFTHFASSVQRNATTPPTSSSWPVRPSAVMLRT